MQVHQVAFASLAAAFVLAAGPAAARTCTAPGHPSCTITCSGGCAALYVEPNGPCRTMCSGAAKTAPAAAGAQQTLDASGMSAKEIMDFLQGKKAEPMSKVPQQKK